MWYVEFEMLIAHLYGNQELELVMELLETSGDTETKETHGEFLSEI